MTQTKYTQVMEWPYPIRYDKEREVITDVLVLGGGASGCFAAINAARKGVKVTIVEKGATIRSGSAGSGIDHWQWAATNPASKVTPEELAQALLRNHNGWHCGITTYIQCRESYDALLELEKMGMKIRDTEDEFKGADFRDEKTKFLFAYDYQNKYTIRIWGTGMKPALYKECKRLGVEIYDRVMATSLLTEGSKQGSKVIGAMGVNVRTGEFNIFKAKATVMSLSRPSQLWMFDSEHIGLYTPEAPPLCSGDGHAMAWNAGAELAMMEKSQRLLFKGELGFGQREGCSGGALFSLFPCSIVDSTGKEVPWVNAKGEPVSPEQRAYPVNVPEQKFFLMGGGATGLGPTPPELQAPQPINAFLEATWDGTPPQRFTLPFYADFSSMSKHERRAIFGLMVGQEGRTSLCYRDLMQAGFNPDKDMLQVYLGGRMPPGYRGWLCGPNGGIIPDWDLRSNLEGLYGAGRSLLAGEDCSNAATTGKYAGRKAAEYAVKAKEPTVERRQVEDEKKRVYAPVRRTEGMEWKELNSGVARIMQDYCGDVKTDELLNIGLKWFGELREAEASTVYAENPHELMRTLEVLNKITCGEAIMHACLARKASSVWLDFERLDYPEKDPPEQHKWVTIKLEDGKVKVGERPIDYWGPLEENYKAHCGLYQLEK